MNNSANNIRKLIVQLLVIILCFLLAHVMANAQSERKRSTRKVGIDYRPTLSREEKTKVLILATPHLTTLQDCFRPSSLDPLLSVLQSFRPDVIGIERVPPAILQDMERRGGFFDEVVNSFDKARVQVGHRMQELMKVSRAEAENKAEALLQSKSELDTDARLRLIAYLLAAYDYDTAVLQWLGLSEDARKQNNLLPDEICAQLNKDLLSPNERISIGVALAKRLGLQSVIGIDDHFDEELLNRVSEQFSKELKNNSEVKAVAQSKFYADSTKQLKAACQNGDEMLRYYLYLNSPDYTSMDVAMQWGVWFRTKLPSGLDRSRVSQWEVRNLNIASRIREATVLYPGKRILVIIGAGHKPFLDSYLSHMLDVRIVQLGELMKTSSDVRRAQMHG